MKGDIEGEEGLYIGFRCRIVEPKMETIDKTSSEIKKNE